MRHILSLKPQQLKAMEIKEGRWPVWSGLQFGEEFHRAPVIVLTVYVQGQLWPWTAWVIFIEVNGKGRVGIVEGYFWLAASYLLRLTVSHRARQASLHQQSGIDILLLPYLCHCHPDINSSDRFYLYGSFKNIHHFKTASQRHRSRTHTHTHTHWISGPIRLHMIQVYTD